EFSLMDFLRDRFTVTRLVLRGPELALAIDETGAFTVPLHLPETVSASNVSVADAHVENGMIRLTDMRTNGEWQLKDVTGGLVLGALRGPFGLNVTGSFRDEPIQLRVNTSPLNPEGAMQVAAFARPAGGAFSLNLDGLLQTG